VQNLLSLWLAMDFRRRIVVAGATLAMFAAVLGLSRMATQPDLVLLYAGLDGVAAGEVIAALDQRGVIYEVRGNAIHVPAQDRDALRMTLAAEGLPATGATGYELLDGLTGFGTTSQMFDAAYWRAKEGELARTISANPLIRAARVHIAQPPARAFQPSLRPTASVTLTTAGGGLSREIAHALKHLVASAVPGMQPSDVSVIDTLTGLVETESASAPFAQVAAERAAELKRNVERLLTARVGPGKAIVEVSLDLVTEQETISERRFDPKERVAISTDTEERSANSTDQGGDVTVASNLPDGDAAAGGGGQSQTSETRERTNFEVSETQRELQRPPGSIRRLTVAVLVDGVAQTAADGTVSIVPRPEEELQVLRELVASTVGLDEARGDQLTLRTLEFQSLPEIGLPPPPALFANIGPIDPLSLVKLAVLALVALVLGLFVVRPLLVNARSPDRLPGAATPLAIAGGAAAGVPVLTGEIEDARGAFGEINAEISAQPAPAPDPVERLKRLIEERQSESVEILRGWMETAEDETP
jgi:flagellar M-ring protein FliF